MTVANTRQRSHQDHVRVLVVGVKRITIEYLPAQEVGALRAPVPIRKKDRAAAQQKHGCAGVVGLFSLRVIGRREAAPTW